MRIRDIITANPGISLIEVLLIITMMSIIIIPEAMLMSQTMSTSQGNYTQANRSNLSNTLAAQIQPNNENLATYMDMSSQSTIVREPNSAFTGYRNTIPFVTKQVAANSNALAKQYAIYEYNNGAAISSPRIVSMVYNSSDEVRVKLQTSIPAYDSSLRAWGPSEIDYNAALKSYGADGYSYTNMGSDLAGPATNLYASTDTYWSEARYEAWYPHAITYSFDVPNGPYTVQLEFNDECDNCGRKMNIIIEGQTMNTNLYDPRAVTGAINRFNILSYDTYVWDGKLTVSVAEDSSVQTQKAICSGIAVLRRDLP